MAYYFAVETTVSSYEGLNIQKSGKYKKLFPNNTKKYESTLEEIDKFTSEYADDRILLNDLIYDGILPFTYYSRMLSIIYVNGIEVRKVAGEILYSDSKKYIENPKLAIEYVNNKIKENDNRFFRYLILKLPEISVPTQMISKLATAMEEKNRYEEKTVEEKLKQPLQKQVSDNFKSDIIRALFEESYIDGEGKLIFSGTINYEKFHDIVAFISEYERILQKENQYTRTKKPQ